MKLESKTFKKSLIISIAVMFVNFFSYWSFPRLFGLREVSIPESLGFLVYESILHAIIIFIVSYLIIEFMGKK